MTAPLRGPHRRRGCTPAGQVVHFDAPSERAAKAWIRGGNTLTDPGLCIHWARVVADDFHARFSARWRRYLYLLAGRAASSALLPRPGRPCRRACGWTRTSMRQGRDRFLLGEHDFTSFRAAGCQARHGVREVQAIDVRRHGELLGVDIRANAFVQHMVRNIVGSLLVVGRGEAEARLEFRRAAGGPGPDPGGGAAAPPEGLCLVEVGYAGTGLGAACRRNRPAAAVRPCPLTCFPDSEPASTIPPRPRWRRPGLSRCGTGREAPGHAVESEPWRLRCSIHARRSGAGPHQPLPARLPTHQRLVAEAGLRPQRAFW
ncbi:MAG: hypothetical protein U5R48_06515 [Gammaproteobacteria bacterium]|nr:hypothetical protein [Gammaproteobacteria bacterium]